MHCNWVGPRPLNISPRDRPRASSCRRHRKILPGKEPSWTHRCSKSLPRRTLLPWNLRNRMPRHCRNQCRRRLFRTAQGDMPHTCCSWQAHSLLGKKRNGCSALLGAPRTRCTRQTSESTTLRLDTEPVRVILLRNSAARGSLPTWPATRKNILRGIFAPRRILRDNKFPGRKICTLHTCPGPRTPFRSTCLDTSPPGSLCKHSPPRPNIFRRHTLFGWRRCLRSSSPSNRQCTGFQDLSCTFPRRSRHMQFDLRCLRFPIRTAHIRKVQEQGPALGEMLGLS